MGYFTGGKCNSEIGIYNTPIVEVPNDCYGNGTTTKCVNFDHPENCRRTCSVLRKNNGKQVKPTASNI